MIERFKYFPRGDVLDYFEDDETTTYTKTEGKWGSLIISNDSNDTALVLTINGMDLTINAGEVLDEDFVSFDTVTITTTVDFRLLLRG
jgi:hypothetical protein